MTLRALASLAACVLLACGSEPARPSASLEADVARLQELLGSDPSRAVLQEIEQAVDGERPVIAAELIEQAGAPSVERQIERFQRAQLATQEGRRLQARAVRTHRARLSALRTYGQLLARGVGTEDAALLDAMHEYADAEIAIVALHDELARIRPLAPGAAERAAEREATLGGLPPLRRDTRREQAGDEPEPPPAEGPDPRSGEPAEPLPE